VTSDPITAGLSQETDAPPDNNCIADARTHCHVFLDRIWSRRKQVWCGGADEGLIECGKAYEWFTDYSTSELVTVCKSGHLRDTMQIGSRLSSHHSFYI